MRRLRAVAAVLATLAVLAPVPAAAVSTSPTPSPTAPGPTLPSASPTASGQPSPSPSTAPSAPPAPHASPTPDPATIAALRSRIGGDLGDALVTQQRLSDALTVSTKRQLELTDRVTATDARIEQLNSEIERLDGEIDATQRRVDLERREVAALARALDRRPRSVLLAFARSDSLGDALRTGTELVVAGAHAHRVETRLRADLDRLSSEREARQDDLGQQSSLRDSLLADLSALQDTLSLQQSVADALAGLLGQFRSAQASLAGQPPDTLASLLALLEAQQRNLNLASFEQAWARATIGAANVQLLTVSATAPNVHLASPEPGAVLTQPFGPTTLWFEPPLGPYAHFHTGVDLAAPAGTPVLAPADGVVTVVSSGPGGYGNYVIVAHGGGIETLYAHLDAFTVAVGDHVSAGQPVGAEGSTGFSTGPHLHFEVRVNGALVDPFPLLPAPAAPAG